MKKTFRLDVVLTAAYDKFLMETLMGDLIPFMEDLDQLALFLTAEADFNMDSTSSIRSELQRQYPQIFKYETVELAFSSLRKEMNSIELDNSYLLKLKFSLLHEEVEILKHDIKSI